jgi:regulator of protease activity HflC (stomatin/prohibitin superfamily)
MEALVALFSSMWETVVLWQVIDPWERGLSIWFGRYVKEKGPGFYFKCPLFQDYVVENTRREIADAQFESVDTLDGVQLAISAALDFEIVDLKAMWLNVKEHEASISNLVEGLTAKHIATHNSDECGYEQLEREVLKTLRPRAKVWGLHIKHLYFTTLARHIPIRLLSN